MKILKTFAMFGILLLSVAGCQGEKGDGPKKPVDPASGDPVVMSDFTVTLTDCEAGFVYLDIVPKDKEMTYYFNLLIEEDALALTDDELLAYDMANFEAIAQQNENTLQGFLDANLINGDWDWRYTGLMANSTYCIYLYGLSSSGEALTAVNKFYFTTPAIRPLDCDFEITVADVQSNSFAVTITPSNERVPYIYDVFPAQYYEEVCGSTPEGVADYVAAYLTELAAQYQVDLPYTVQQVSTFDAVSDEFTTANAGITPNTVYYVYAVGIAPDGTTTTDAVVKQVVTGKPPVNTFSTIPGSVGHSSASYTVSPLHNEAYVAVFERASLLKDEDGNQLSDDEIIKAVIASQGSLISNHLYSGNATISECPLVPGEDYYLLVFGYFSGKVTTPLTKVEFATPPATRDTDQSFEIMTSGRTQTSFAVSFSPYYTKRPFIANYMPYDTFVEYGANAEAVLRYNSEVVEELYQKWAYHDDADMAEFLHRRLYTDYVSQVIEGLEPGTKYIVYAVGMTADGSYTTDVFYEEVETVPVYDKPEFSRILPSPYGNGVYMYFYFNTDSPAVYYGMESHVNDDTLYNKSDAEILAYYLDESEKIKLWPVGNLANIQPFTVAAKGDVIYYTGVLLTEPSGYTVSNRPIYDAATAVHTIVRHTYTMQ